MSWACLGRLSCTRSGRSVFALYGMVTLLAGHTGKRPVVLPPFRTVRSATLGVACLVLVWWSSRSANAEAQQQGRLARSLPALRAPSQRGRMVAVSPARGVAPAASGLRRADV